MLCCGMVIAFAEDKILIKADSLNNATKDNKVLATGNVKFIKNDYTILSEKIIFDRKDKKIIFDGKTKLLDIDKNNIFAENGEISDDISEGIFNNAGIILNNGISLISPTINKKNNKYSMKKCIFYFCKNNDLNIELPYDKIKKEIGRLDKQPLSLYSSNSRLDKDKKKIYFENVFLKFFNVPIFYLPYFSTSAGLRKNVSGLSNPRVLSSSSYGFGAEASLLLYLLEDNLLLKTTPTFYTRHKNILVNNKISYHKENKFLYDLNYAFAFDNGASENIKNVNGIREIDENGYKKYKDYINFNLKQKFNDRFFYVTNFYDTSDNYLLRDYLDDYSEFLNSNFLLFKGFFEYDFLKIDILRTRMIRERENENVLDNPSEVVNVEYFYNKNLYEKNNSNLDLNIDFDLSSVFDHDGDEYGRSSVDINLNYNKLLNDLLLEFNIDLHHNNYSYLYANKIEGESKNRTIIDFNLNVNHTIIFDKISIQPIVQYYYNNSNEKKIFTDKDSKSSMLNITNIFSANRYSGHDLFEYGTRINYGIELTASIGGYSIELITAQGYKSDMNTEYGIENFRDNYSDILNGFNIINADNTISFSLSNAIAKDTLQIKRQEFIFNLLYKKIELETTYSLSRFVDEISEFTPEEQLNIVANYRLNSNLKFGIEINNDLERKKTISLKTNIIFEGSCLKLELSARKYDYSDFDKQQNGWNFNVSLRIKN
jgi:LPS-assembly protein